MVVHTGQAEGGGIEGCRGLAVRPERLAVEIELGIELARPPGLQRPLDLGFRDLKHVGEGGQVRGRRDDRADVEVAIGPAIEAVADARGVGVVDGRVAQGALDADRGEGLPSSEKKPVTPTTALAFSRTSVLAGSARSTSPLPERLGHVGGDGVYIDLEAELERLARG